MRVHLPRTVVAFLLFLAAAGSAFAQGKIAGRVTDATTGEGLIGLNVLIVGTQQGTVTDLNGNYVLVNVRPGAYSLLFSYIGYSTQQVDGVEVSTGQTTRYDVRLREQVIEGEEIVVQAERPLVQKDLTASKKVVGAEEIDALPVEGFLGVLTTQAGVNQGPGGEIHIRGGRSNEISFLVDGLSVGNPFETNGLATSLAADAIQEMTVISGAFNAEYGKAMSGIVNLVTKEGADRYEGSFSAYGGDTFTRHDEIFWTPSTPRLNVYTLEGSLAGPLPLLRRVRFFVSGRRDVDGGNIFGVRLHAPSDSANFNATPWYYEIQGKPWQEYLSGSNGEGLPVPDERVAMNDGSSYNVLAKLTTRLFRGVKLEYSFLRDYSKYTPFNFFYRFNPDGVAAYRDGSYNHSLRVTHTLDDRTFYTVGVSYARNAAKSYLHEDPLDADYTSSGAIVGFPGNNFLFGGDEKGHVYETADSFRSKFDLTRQIGVTHEVKVGGEVQLHSLDRENFVVLFDGNRYRRPTIESLASPSHDRYVNQRVGEFSAYAQDKIEFDSFIINVGLRFERFDPHGRAVSNVFSPRGVLGSGDPLEYLEDAEAKNMVMPRLGVSFPITNEGIIHFSYGHFAQMPRLRNLYVNPEFEFPPNSVPTFGNANMRPERTVQYEIGLQQQIGALLAVDVTAFFKDIRDYLAAQDIVFSEIAGDNRYVIYLNQDYANIQGITLALTKRRSRDGLLAATIDYTFQIAEGNNNNSGAFFYNALSGRETEFEIVPLDYDQRHVLSSTVTLGRPRSWSLSFIGQFSSGYPYSPVIVDQNIDLLPKSGRKPSQLNVDVHAYKELSIGSLQFRVFAKAFNLLDRLNERFVFDDTGRATYSLDYTNAHATWRPFYALPGIQDLATYNTRPHWYSAPREVRAGIQVSF